MQVFTASDRAGIRAQVARHIAKMHGPEYETLPGLAALALLQTLHGVGQDAVALSLILVLSLAGNQREDETLDVLLAVDACKGEMPDFSAN